MTDSSYPLIMQSVRNVDLFDDDWILDQLSDDDIELPSEIELNEDDDDDEFNDGVDPDDVWDDLGLEKFNIDLATNTTIDPPNTANIALTAISSNNNNQQSASNSNVSP